MRRGLLIMIACVCCSASGGCLSFFKREAVVVSQGPVYPGYGVRGSALDIQIAIDSDQKQVTLTNTSPMRFGPSTLWLNGWYGHEIEGFDVGQTLVLPISSFLDEFGEEMVGGGFFSIRAPRPLVLAELETSGELRGLVVVRTGRR